MLSEQIWGFGSIFYFNVVFFINRTIVPLSHTGTHISIWWQKWSYSCNCDFQKHLVEEILECCFWQALHKLTTYNGGNGRCQTPILSWLCDIQLNFVLDPLHGERWTCVLFISSRITEPLELFMLPVTWQWIKAKF